MRIPGATYRLQFNRNFGFAQAREILQYLAELGVTDCYASPLFQAAPLSEHGYNVCGFGQINCELGKPEDFDEFTAKLKELGMGLLLDVVPNHMAADPANPWWRDVLEKGPASPYANYFDIDWIKKLLVPILGDQYAKVLERGELKLSFKDGFYIDYFDKSFPVGAAAYPGLQAASQSGGMQKLLDSYRENPDKLHTLLEQNPYRLAYWRTTAEDLNYRRFFDVTELVGLRVELPEVFTSVHELVFQLVEQGKVTGLRIDHPDGLREPTQYFERLKEKAGNVYVVAEKILMPGEPLREDWPIAGTTGYEFLNLLNGIFVDAKNREAFDRIYEDFTGCRKDFHTVAYESKKKVLLLSFQSEVNGLTGRLKELASRTRYGQDLILRQLEAALLEVISCFPVYRTYFRETQDKLDATAEAHVKNALREAKARNGKVEPEAYAFLESLLLLRWPADFSEEDKLAGREFIMRFQQLTGPSMAKGWEDTAFYNYNRLISLNEVGGNPGDFGISLEHFHWSNEERLTKWPGSMLATATHDTKRGEDVRARLNVLSEIPAEWEKAIHRWRELNAPHKRVVAGQEAPTANDEYFLYQTLIGAWPMTKAEQTHLSPALPENFVERIVAYMIKALKESKANTSWTDPNEAYEAAVTQFVRKVLEPSHSNAFLKDFLPFQRKVSFFGQFNSLAQVLLKCTCPGVPDFYQGTELWDFSLVDPDNRRPVDFGQRRALLADLRRRGSDTRNSPEFLQNLLKESHTGQIKMFIAHGALQFRRDHRELFEKGEYVPLQASDPGQEHVGAFLRRWHNQTAIVVTPRLVLGLTGGREFPPIGEPVWRDTWLIVPEFQPGQKFTEVLSHEKMVVSERQGERGLPLAEVFKEFPLALLTSG